MNSFYFFKENLARGTALFTSNKDLEIEPWVILSNNVLKQFIIL